jgi:hypothetical protein
MDSLCGDALSMGAPLFGGVFRHGARPAGTVMRADRSAQI